MEDRLIGHTAAPQGNRDLIDPGETFLPPAGRRPFVVLGQIG